MIIEQMDSDFTINFILVIYFKNGVSIRYNQIKGL